MKHFGAVVVALSCLVSTLALAQPMKGGGPGGMPPDAAQRLGISPDQMKKVQQLKFDAKEQMISLRADVERARLELERLLAAPTIDQKAVMAQVDKVTKAQGELKKNRIGLMLKVRDVIGPDAFQKLQMERRERREGRMHGRGRGMHMRGGMGEADPMMGPGAGPGEPDEMFANGPPPPPPGEMDDFGDGFDGQGADFGAP